MAPFFGDTLNLFQVGDEKADHKIWAIAQPALLHTGKSYSQGNVKYWSHSLAKFWRLRYGSIMHVPLSATEYAANWPTPVCCGLRNSWSGFRGVGRPSGTWNWMFRIGAKKFLKQPWSWFGAKENESRPGSLIQHDFYVAKTYCFKNRK
mgnify:CR=1 FL=1